MSDHKYLFEVRGYYYDRWETVYESADPSKAALELKSFRSMLDSGHTDASEYGLFSVKKVGEGDVDAMTHLTHEYVLQGYYHWGCGWEDIMTYPGTPKGKREALEDLAAYRENEPRQYQFRIRSQKPKEE